MFKKYDSEIRKIVAAKDPNTNWKNILEDHKEIISKIQHERLIHLLVTIFVGMIMAATALIIIVTEKITLLFLCAPLLLLFLGYLFHYRFLENTTQKWYLVEEQLKKYTRK